MYSIILVIQVLLLLLYHCLCCSRGHFEAARKAWEEYGDQSEMFVIIIDEIDAICKPRGNSPTLLHTIQAHRKLKSIQRPSYAFPHL